MLTLTTVAVAVGGTTASAATQDFCGAVRASTTGYPGPPSAYCASGTYSNWTYVSNTYYGGGNITRMRAGIFTASGIGYYHFYADNTTFISACYSGFLSTNYGIINQYETTGASHTLYGHMDDSPNHTGCFAIV